MPNGAGKLVLGCAEYSRVIELDGGEPVDPQLDLVNDVSELLDADPFRRTADGDGGTIVRDRRAGWCS